MKKQDDYTLMIANTMGQHVYEESLNNFSGTYKTDLDITPYGKGVYMLSITNSKNEVVKKVLVY